jgi:hypothetical protein
MEQEKQLTSLPENAYRELKPGEEYTPIMPASSSPREVTPYSVTMGIVMAIVFSAAAAFLGLKVGQVFEAAIPIAIIAVGMGNVMGKRNMLGQNVIIQSIGASSGVIVAGSPSRRSTSSGSTRHFTRCSSRRSSAGCWESCC